MKKSEAPPFPKTQSYVVTSGRDKFFMHPNRNCWVVAPTPDVWVFYGFPTFEPLRYATRAPDGQETVHEFEPEGANLHGTAEVKVTVSGGLTTRAGEQSLREFVRWVAWGSEAQGLPLAEPRVVAAARELVPKEG